TLTLVGGTNASLAHPVPPDDLAPPTRLNDDAAAMAGHPSLGDAVWRPPARPLEPASAGVVAVDDGRAVGFAYVHRSDNVTPVHWDLGFVVHPDAREDAKVAVALLDRAVEHTAGHGGGLVVLWIFEPDERDDEVATRAGFRRQRDLLQMRVALPLGESTAWPPGVEVRPFVPGEDNG